MATKKEFIAQEVARAVGAGKAVAMETVDFSDPNRPMTGLSDLAIRTGPRPALRWISRSCPSTRSP